MLQGLDGLGQAFSLGRNHWVFDYQLLEIAFFVNFFDELALSNTATLVDKECHDSLGNQVCDVLLGEIEVGLNEILNDARLHYDSGRLVLSSHLRLNIRQNDGW